MVRKTTTEKIIAPAVMLILGLVLLTASTAQAANITVTASRNPVALDDSFHLVYEADSSVDDDPDFSPVYKDFDVLSSSQSTNMRSINGNWSLKKSWDLAVIAKQTGKFTIPAISFGKDVSPAIQITVTSSSSSSSVSPDGQSTVPAKIFLESSLDKKSGWVQSQFIYTVRLLRTVNISGASLTAPETSDPDAIIHLIREDQYQTTRNGTRYEVIERRYAIFPQKSGQLTINPVTFEGRVNVSQPQSIFDQFRMSGQMKRIRSKAQRATVNPAPENIRLQDWLPASDVQLTQEWSADVQAVKVGEPVTRTITINAEGLTGVQLPDPDIGEVDGLKQYPDKAVTENREGNTGIIGLKQIKVALIPAASGSYTLPEITLPWWNTTTGKLETAVLPAVELHATGGTATADSLANVPAPQGGLTENGLSANNAGQQTAAQATVDEPYWKWLSLAFGLAWIITLIALVNKSGTRQTGTAPKPVVKDKNLRAAVAAVKQHANNNDPGQTRAALVHWAKLHYAADDITNLSRITKYCSPLLGQQIAELNRILYSPDQRGSWDGKTLLQAFRQEQADKHRNKSAAQSALRPLYNDQA